jgi:hypothetical protein
MTIHPDPTTDPEVTQSAGQVLYARLQTLYLQAGRPASREIARRAGHAVSHATVAKILRWRPSAPAAAPTARKLPRWELFEAVIEALGGEKASFQMLWARAYEETDVGGQPVAAPAAAASPPLVGRQRILDQFRIWTDELTAGCGRAVMIEGEAGIGKSSLVRAVARAAEVDGMQVLWGICDELTAEFPLQPLLDALAPAGARRDAIVELLHGPAVGGPRADPVPTAVTRLVTLVQDQCADGRRSILVLDDLQWADRYTVAALSRLAVASRTTPLLLVGMVRPVPRRPHLNQLRRKIGPDGLLRLPSLTEAEVAELVETVIDGLPGPRLLGLAAAAAGNPFFICELVDALSRSGGLVNEDGTVEAVVTEAPRSLCAALRDRISSLPDSLRDVLRIAALLGLEFSAAELSLATGRPVRDLVGPLDEAIASGVLRDGRPNFAFRHPLLRTALYDAIPLGTRDDWHRQLARQLARRDASPERVARQLLQIDAASDAGESVDGWVAAWLHKVGPQLVNRAPRAAVALLDRALSRMTPGVGVHDALTCRLADALYRTGNISRAATVASNALAHITRSELLVDLHCTLVQCQSMCGQSSESIAALDPIIASKQTTLASRARLLVLAAACIAPSGR